MSDLSEGVNIPKRWIIGAVAALLLGVPAGGELTDLVSGKTLTAEDVRAIIAEQTPAARTDLKYEELAIIAQMTRLQAAIDEMAERQDSAFAANAVGFLRLQQDIRDLTRVIEAER